MATPDVPRPNYVSVDLEAPITLRLSGPRDGQHSAVASLAPTPAGVILTLSGDQQMAGMTAEGHDLAEAVQLLLRSFASQGLTVHACGNCTAFRFSSMSYQMSGGQKGYCTVNGIANTGGPNDVVSLLDRCDAFRPRASERSWWDEGD